MAYGTGYNIRFGPNPTTGETSPTGAWTIDEDTGEWRPAGRSSSSGMWGDKSEEEARYAASAQDQGFSQDAQANSPTMKSYRDALYAAVMQAPGSAAYKQGDYYKSLQNDITQQMRRQGWAAGNDAASRGVLTPGSYGAGRIGAGDRSEMEDRLRLAASGQAQQAWSQEQTRYIDGLLRAAGFEKGIADTKFEHWYMTEALRNGISQAEAQATLEAWKMALNLGGQVGGIAATLITGNPGPALVTNSGRFNPAGGPPGSSYQGNPY